MQEVEKGEDTIMEGQQEKSDRNSKGVNWINRIVNKKFVPDKTGCGQLKTRKKFVLKYTRFVLKIPG